MFLIFNIIFMIALYGMLCNTALIKKTLSNNGLYIYDRSYIIGDLITNKEMPALYIISFMLAFVPITWIICIFIAFIIWCAYNYGLVELFGKNKINY